MPAWTGLLGSAAAGGPIPGGSATSGATAGPITVGGLTFAPSNQDTILTAAVVVGLAFAAVMLFRKG